FAGPRCQLIRSEHERPEAAPASLGLNPAFVDYVLITPLQPHATANIPLFPNAHVYISKRASIADYHAPKDPRNIARELRIPDPVAKYLMFDAPDKLRLVDEEDEILPGLTAFWAGVHHRSSMAYQVDSLKGRVSVTDSFFKYGNVEEMHPLGINESMD